MNNNILIVDDEREIRDLLEINFINEGYNVFKACSGEEALEILNEEQVDIMVLDIMIPGMSGLEVCKKIRESHTLPILMLSAKVEDIDRIQGIMTGADDYMCKPFNTLELIVRVKALLRRTYFFNNKAKEESDVIRIETMVINKKKHKVSIDGKDLTFTAREFEILYLLATNRGRVFSAEEIFSRVWEEAYFQSNNTVMVHMSRIRDKIEKYLPGANIIHTVWGVGYKIEK